MININFLIITHFYEIFISITTHEGSAVVEKLVKNITVDVDKRLEIHCNVSGENPKIRWKIGKLLRYLAIIFKIFSSFLTFAF